MSSFHHLINYYVVDTCSIHIFIIMWFDFQVGERIRVILDCEDNTLSFERNYEFLGVAFRGNFLVILMTS